MTAGSRAAPRVQEGGPISAPSGQGDVVLSAETHGWGTWRQRSDVGGKLGNPGRPLPCNVPRNKVMCAEDTSKRRGQARGPPGVPLIGSGCGAGRGNSCPSRVPALTPRVHRKGRMRHTPSSSPALRLHKQTLKAKSRGILNVRNKQLIVYVRIRLYNTLYHHSGVITKAYPLWLETDPMTCCLDRQAVRRHGI